MGKYSPLQTKRDKDDLRIVGDDSIEQTLRDLDDNYWNEANIRDRVEKHRNRIIDNNKI